MFNKDMSVKRYSLKTLEWIIMYEYEIGKNNVNNQINIQVK